MQELTLAGTTGRCRIMLGERVEHLGALCGGRRAVLVTDPNVRKHQGERFAGFDVVEIGVGEGVKTLDTVRALYEAFLHREMDRSCLIVGVGGGIVCDITGFAACTYQRGLAFGFAPTTLLAQVDAAIGGKNGVNLQRYKNMVGVIRQPEFVLVDSSTLRTLSAREVRCGLAELIKAAVIGDRSLFELLEEQASALLAAEEAIVERVVADAIAVKVRLVEADEMERGPRMKLNFGHTLGHALEKTLGIAHGEAVSIGMVAAAGGSVARALLSRRDADRLKALLDTMGLPTAVGRAELDAALDAIRQDKKRRGGKVHLALLEAIGSAVICPIDVEEIEGVFDDLCSRS